MNADPAFTQWRGTILLGEAIARSPAPKAAHHAASAIDQIAAQIMRPPPRSTPVYPDPEPRRRIEGTVAQPNWPALGLAGIEDAEARN